MGRTLVAEEEVKTVLSSSQESQQIRTGLLLGQVTEAKDFICSAVLTPSLQELDAAEGEAAKVKEDGFEDWWVVEHAAQVYGLLPGGISIVGVFVCCPTPSLPPLQARLSKVLTDIASRQEFKGHQPHQHSSLLHYCSTKKKFKCQTINLGDAQAGFRPAELKFKAHVSQWCKVEATMSLDSECVLPPPPPHPCEEGEEKGRSKSKSQLELAQARVGLSEVLEGLQGAVVTLRGQLVQNTSSPLLQHSSKKSKQPSPSSETIQGALYLRKSGCRPRPPVAVPEGSRRASLKGKMALLAYLQPKATAAEAIAAVQQDACRSLVARLQAAVEGQEETFPEQLPVRVALSTSTSLLPFTEYSLPHEDTQECVSRAGELLGTSAETLVVTPLEQFPASGREDTPSPVTSQESEKQDSSETALKRYYGIASVLASISIVLISISVWIILQ